MTTAQDIMRRHIWLLAELHAGNHFSPELLWRWLIEAQAVIDPPDG
jgi:hypothetical protein